MLNRLHRAFFYVLVFLIPLNLGKHFVTPASYVHGLLVDYLIPTVYVQDVIVLFLLSLQLLAGALTSKKSPFAYVRMLFGDIFCRLRGSITGTLLVDGDLVKVLAWYDNEWGYSNRLVEMGLLVGK